MRVCNFTSPANFFHALRRQALDPIKKPLIVMAPKSLLRHPLAISSIREFTDETFRPVIPADTDPNQAKRLVICSGKVYYDLIQVREKWDPDGVVAIARLEQFYPFPTNEIRDELERYTAVQNVCWVQEEPRNMGAWTKVQCLIDELLYERDGDCCLRVQYVGRPASASTATGSAKRHVQIQAKLLEAALSTS
jgi:2-oxoglutarate dehydrogenase E1 component